MIKEQKEDVPVSYKQWCKVEVRKPTCDLKKNKKSLSEGYGGFCNKYRSATGIGKALLVATYA